MKFEDFLVLTRPSTSQHQSLSTQSESSLQTTDDNVNENDGENESKKPVGLNIKETTAMSLINELGIIF